MTTNLHKLIHSALRHSIHVFMILLGMWPGLAFFCSSPAIAAQHDPVSGGEEQAAVSVTLGKVSDAIYLDAVQIQQGSNTHEQQGQPRASMGEATWPDYRNAGGVTTCSPARPTGSNPSPAMVDGTTNEVAIDAVSSPDRGTTSGAAAAGPWKSVTQ